MTPGTGNSILNRIRSVFSGTNPTVGTDLHNEVENEEGAALASLYSQETEKTRTNSSSRKSSANNDTSSRSSMLNDKFADAAKDKEMMQENQTRQIRRSERTTMRLRSNVN
jgi:hypothetical protein